MVVIAIIALLVSILLPSLTTARNLARNAACSANERSLGITVALYANDYDDYLPQHYGKSPAKTGPGYDPGIEYRGWGQKLMPYAGDLKMFLCPAHEDRSDIPITSTYLTESNCWNAFTHGNAVSYGWNNYNLGMNDINQSGKNGGVVLVQISQVTNPNEMVAIIDSCKTPLWEFTAVAFGANCGSYGGDGLWSFTRHMNKWSNVLFLGGQVAKNECNSATSGAESTYGDFWTYWNLEL